MDIEEQYDKVYRYCYFRLHNRQLAQDITQETFLRYYRQELSLDTGRELPYLYTIAKNLCVDEFRKKPFGSMGGSGTEGGSNSVAAVCDRSEEWIDSMVLRAAIEKLPQEEQELLFLKIVNEVSVASICKITGISRFAVYRRLSKALKRLKKELIKEGFSE